MHRLTSAFFRFVSKCQNGSRLKLSVGENVRIFAHSSQNMGARGSKKAYTRARTGMYLHTKFGCDRSVVVGCRSRNAGYRQTDRQTESNDNKAHSLRVVTQYLHSS